MFSMCWHKIKFILADRYSQAKENAARIQDKLYKRKFDVVFKADETLPLFFPLATG